MFRPRVVTLLLVAGAMGILGVLMVVSQHALARMGGVAEAAPAGLASRSLGFPWQGALLGAVALRPSRYVRHVAEYRDRGHFYGTLELVRLLQRVARGVAFRLPGARLSVGELSRRYGGEIGGHQSHQNGRDVDLGFYVNDRNGVPAEASRFVEFGRSGVGRGRDRHLRFDDARNWELVSRLLTDADASVQYIFVSRALKRRLLAEARQRRAPAWVLRRARVVMREPRRGHRHRNHFHVRIYCPPAHLPSCRDRGPYWPWVGAPSLLASEPAPVAASSWASISASAPAWVAASMAASTPASGAVAASAAAASATPPPSDTVAVGRQAHATSFATQ
ncbi:MAG: penicillin-insensitive murein endopeptidase [Proteobacteria bacterium]|nr:penicillin-insensitive murein endopeptidase [Pseudomonadota bacterium]